MSTSNAWWCKSNKTKQHVNCTAGRLNCCVRSEGILKKATLSWRTQMLNKIDFYNSLCDNVP